MINVGKTWVIFHLLKLKCARNRCKMKSYMMYFYKQTNRENSHIFVNC